MTRALLQETQRVLLQWN